MDIGRRRNLAGLTGEAHATLDEVREHLRRWRTETLEAIDLLHAHRTQVDAVYNRLENPKAVIEYLDAFVELFTRISAELAAVDEALGAAPSEEQACALRQLAANASLEQRRCLVFRDKCINKPLPYEDMRPLLNQISMDTRDQLLEYGDLNLAAARIEALAGAGPDPKDGHVFDRRSLFTRFLPKR
jgi:hypothetical protein